LVGAFKTTTWYDRQPVSDLRFTYFTFVVTFFLFAFLFSRASLLRYVRQAEDSLNSIVAGAVAGWISIKFCDETLKQEIVLLAFSRAIIALLSSYIERWHIHVFALISFSFGFFFCSFVLSVLLLLFSSSSSSPFELELYFVLIS
jgi:hypothetical protein